MKRKGFTLIELIVVIAIIGILATVILIAVSNQTPKAKRAAAVESLNGAINAANMCVANGDSVKGLTSTAATPTGDICSGTDVNAEWPTIAGYPYKMTGSASGIATITITNPSPAPTGGDVVCSNKQCK